MICREHLLKSIQAVHSAVISYANCICVEANEDEREMLFASGLELSRQLSELRLLYMNQYKVDPITGFHPEMTFSCDYKNQL
ncbi:hypothetical protein J7E73_28890 [Paenibacillus albidus]|uniref:hypothetical protein n=1 Tax=Paenibacillus albidus TaxID=2041023 RepID=UPI001BEBB657|nr:hypothetical protein [Paenibacillus albidus]MBT2293058.1 hypothetical protein [Paenibacillus albidus]